MLCSGERLSVCSWRGAELPGGAGPWFKRRCDIWIMSLSAMSPFKYSVLQFHPWGGRYAWLLPSASALSVGWELLHCSVPPPAPLPHAFLWLMVGYIYIFFQQCCRASESPPLQDREGIPWVSRERQQNRSSAAATSRLLGMLGLLTGRSLQYPPWLGGKRERSGQRRDGSELSWILKVG